MRLHEAAGERRRAGPGVANRVSFQGPTMHVANLASGTNELSTLRPAAPQPPAGKLDSKEARRVFNQFVGETFYGQMLGAMRKTVGKPAYFHGGRAEEVFQQQLDQEMARQMTETGRLDFGSSMFELSNLTRS
jgi:peptidoglycan hydrolase FlgJ